MTLHLRLKKLRGLRQFTQQQMADLLHMSRSAYTKVEADPGKCRLELLHRIAAVLQVQPTLLISSAPNEVTHWNDFDLMLESAFHHLSVKLAVVAYDDLTLEQVGLITSKGFGSREAYEDTPLRGRLYSYGPRQIIDRMMRELGYSTLFEHHLVQHPTWLAHWERYQRDVASKKAAGGRPGEVQPHHADEVELDEQTYLVVFMLTLTMPDGSEQHLELAQRDIPEGMDEEQALQQIIRSRGAVEGGILCYSVDGYTPFDSTVIVTDIYAK